MSFGNGHGDFKTTRERDLAVHDRAPPLLRQIGSYAVEHWSSESLLAFWTKGRARGVSEVELGAQLVRLIARRDLARTAQFYGPAHPEARPA